MLLSPAQSEDELCVFRVFFEKLSFIYPEVDGFLGFLRAKNKSSSVLLDSDVPRFFWMEVLRNKVPVDLDIFLISYLALNIRSVKQVLVRRRKWIQMRVVHPNDSNVKVQPRLVHKDHVLRCFENAVTYAVEGVWVNKVRVVALQTLVFIALPAVRKLQLAAVALVVDRRQVVAVCTSETRKWFYL
jgi:hypothetical protein